MVAAANAALGRRFRPSVAGSQMLPSHSSSTCLGTSSKSGARLKSPYSLAGPRIAVRTRNPVEIHNTSRNLPDASITKSSDVWLGMTTFFGCSKNAFRSGPSFPRTPFIAR